MRTPFRLSTLCFVTALTALASPGCGGGEVPGDPDAAADAGLGRDVGSESDAARADGAASDGGPDQDATAPIDAALFDGAMPTDASGPDDAATPIDAATPTDAATPVDAAPTPLCDPATCLAATGETCWSCWSERPLPGASATVPVGARILLDEPITVDTLSILGELRAHDVALRIDAHGIEIDGGRFEAGTDAAPRVDPLTIQLSGPTRSVHVANGGSLHVVATAPSPTWTTLSGGALAGVNTLALAEPTTWRAGDEVIVTPTGHYAHPPPFRIPTTPALGETERRSLAAASGASVTLATGLATERAGLLDASAHPVDLRASIGNLTRLVVLAGADDADWTAGRGIVVRSDMGTELVLDGVRVERGGTRVTATTPGAAAITAHDVAGTTTTRIERSVVVDAASRGIVLEGSQNDVVRDDIVTGVVGHGLWIVYGVESGNVVDHNLFAGLRETAAYSPAAPHETAALSPGSDTGFCGPSGIVLGSPSNALTDNAVADTPGCGYWLSFPARDIGAFAGSDHNPSRVAMGTFAGNASESTGGPGVMMGQVISQDPSGLLVGAHVVYQPQADARASAPTGDASLRGVLERTRVVGSLAGAFVVEGRVTLVDSVTWGTGGLVLQDRSETLTVQGGTFVGRLGSPAQPFGEAMLIEAFAPDALTITGAHLAHLRASTASGNGGVLFSRGVVLGMDLTLEHVSATTFEDIDLGLRRPTPPLDGFDIVGPSLDTAGLGGFPGRWWSRDLPYFTTGYTCDPSRADASSSGVLCAVPGYMMLAETSVATGASPTASTPDVVLARPNAAGAPTIGYPLPVSSLSGRQLSFAVPSSEVVELRLPAYPTTPRNVSFVAWGRTGQRALVRIRYPAGTTFEIRAQEELSLGGFFGVTAPYTAVSSIAAAAAGTGVYYFDGTYLYVPIVGGDRGATPAVVTGFPHPYWSLRITIRAANGTTPLP